MKRKLIIFSIFILSLFMLVGIFIYAANGDWLPNNGAIITDVEIVSRNTGTGPFDENDEPGNDSSDKNDIVRSFDQITWTLENTMAINNTGDQYYTGGTIYFEASIPDNLIGLAKWNTDSMSWIEDLEVSKDQTTIKGCYIMPDVDTTVPGKQSLVFVLDVLGAPNGTRIQASFTTWLEGNDQSNKKTYIDDIITVSAKPAYNIELVKNSLNRETNMPDPNNSENELYGKVFGYAAVLSMINTNSETKGSKGIEYPSGDITFDIELDLSREGSDEYENGSITDIVMPLLYQYSIDGEEDNLAYNDGREFFDIYGGSGYNYPFANREKYEEASQWDIITSIYESGKYKLVQEGNIIHVTVKDYNFDGYFPTNYCYQDEEDDIVYDDGRKNFSLLGFQLFVPINEETEKEGKYYVTAHTNNFNATSISDQKVNEQSINEDDESRYGFLIGERGGFDKIHQFYDEDNDEIIQSGWAEGDAVAYKGQKIRLVLDLVQYASNSPTYDRVEEQNILFKFDGDCYEPDSENFTPISWFDGDGEEFKYNVFYVAKKDGSNWNNQEEQNNARIEDLVYYSSLEDLYNDGKEICVGVLLESYYGWEANMPNQSWNNNCQVSIPVVIKNTAVVGNTYSFTSDVRLYDADLDRSIDSVAVKGFNGYSKESMVDFFEAPNDYVKTEYDEYRQIVEGTHNNVYTGNSILIVDGESTIDISVTQTDEYGNPKVNYDYSKNEYDVDYILSPSVIPYPSLNIDKEITVYVEATLDYRVNYIYGTCNYGEPEILTNQYGDLVLRWEINNYKAGEKIEPLTFTAHMSEEIENGEQLSAYASVYAPEIDGRVSWQREDDYTVEIIDLSSHRLYKTTDTSVTEKNGEIHYTVSYKNNTDEIIDDFKLLDILPYNGDSRGSSFHGTYKIDRIDVTQWDENGNELEDNNNIIIKYTNDEKARENISVDDEDLGYNWNEVDSYVINDSVTALALIGKIGRQQKLVLDIYLKPAGNEGGDIYYNDTSAKVYNDTASIVTPSVSSTVVERSISGYVWLDSNRNGLMDDEEEKLQNIEIKLTDDDGNEVRDVDGNKILPIYTDDKGYYCFDALIESEYIVSVVYDENKYDITSKNVGYNTHINSKFNQDNNSTDIITKLSNTILPVMEEDYQNVGLIENSGIIKVLHVLEGTDISDPENITDLLYPIEEYRGNIGNEYTTVDRLDEINNNSDKKYELISKTDNYIGYYQSSIQYVIYYYNVLGNITITKVDSLDNDIKLSGAKYKLEKLNEDGSLNTEFSTVEKETNEDGVIIFDGLSVGKYRITEIKAPNDYSLSMNSKIIDINKDNTNINIIMENSKKIILPETGSFDFSIVLSFVGISIMIISLRYILKKEK